MGDSPFSWGTGEERLRVSKVAVPVSLRLLGGEHRAGEVHLFPGVGDGRERVSDLLNGPEEFFPLSAPGGATSIVGKRQIATVTVPGRFDAHLPEAPIPGIPEIDVEVVVGGLPERDATVRGRLVIEMPPEQSRLLDFVNGSPAFFAVVGTGAVTLVAKRQVREVRTLGPSSARKPVAAPASARKPAAASASARKPATTPARKPAAALASASRTPVAAAGKARLPVPAAPLTKASAKVRVSSAGKSGRR